MSEIYIALIHYPVKRKDQVIASSITNMDIHDISRTALTYGLSGYFVVHPDEKQRKIANTLAGYWTNGDGKEINPDRSSAVSQVQIVDNLDTVKSEIFSKHGKAAIVFGTSAIKNPKNIPLSDVKKMGKNPILILFGTAGGIDEQLFDNIDYFIEPIDIGTGYNHLSVRSAVAIFVDRLHSYE